jgi:filamentous hemagglutinin family protein
MVAVGEHTAGQGKAAGTGVRTVVFPSSSSTSADNFVGLLKSVFASVALSFVTVGYATAAGPAVNTLPTGAQVKTGNVAISTTGTTMNINQTTDKASVNWNSFSIGKDAKVNVVQNSAKSVLLNRVVGNDPSQIFGQLNAKGQVILINPNGVVFGKDGSVTASAFTASTFGMTDADFLAGKHKFSRNGSTAGVKVEDGATIDTTGYVALIGAGVDNQGAITTQGGAVVLAAGDSVALPSALTDNIGVPLSGKVRLELLPSTINAMVANSGTITTEGGQVLMQAAALSDAVASVTHTGTIDTTGAQGGAVTLQADHGIIKATGNIKANSKNAKNKGGDIIIGRDEVTGVLAKATNVSGAKLESLGGFVETSGDWLATNGTTVKAKDWLLDPYNINIVSSDPTGTPYTDGDSATAGVQYVPGATSNILASDIATNLNAGTSVTINTAGAGTDAGDITVSAAIAKTTGSSASLSLIADRNLTLNKDITSSADQLNINLTAKTGYVSGAGNLGSNGGLITIDSAAAGTMTGAITGTGGLTKTGAGTITLQGAKAYTGATTVSTGTLSLTTAAATYASSTDVGSLYSSSGFNIASGANLDFNLPTNASSNANATTFSGAGTVTKTGGGSLMWGIGGSNATKFKLDAGSLFDVQAGTIKASSSYAGDWTWNKSSLNIASGATFDTNEGNVRVDALTGLGTLKMGWTSVGGITTGVNNTAAGIYNTTTGTATFDGVISANTTVTTVNGITGGTFAKTGTGTQILRGANSYIGATTVSGGTLVNTNMGNFKTSSIAIATDATFEANVASNTQFSGNTTVSGAGTFKKTGGLGLTLSSSNTRGLKFANNAGGLIDIQAGSLQNDSLFGALSSNLADINIAANSLLDMRGEAVQMRGLTGSGNVINTYASTNSLTIGVGAASGNSFIYSGVIGANVGNPSILWNNGSMTNATASQTVNLTKSGAGTQILTGTNIYTGTTTISTGTLQIGASGTTGTLGTNTGAITNNGNLTINRSDAFGIANVISGSGSITQAGTGTTTLTGANIYSGITRVSGGTLQVGNGGGTGTLGTGNVTLSNGSNLSYQRNVSTSIANAISGAGNVLANITGGDLAVTQAINLSGGGNIYLKTTNGSMSTSAAMKGTNINLDNTAGTINTTTGAIEQGLGFSTGAAAGIAVGGSLTATENVNILGVNKLSGTGSATNGIGVNLASSAPITAKNISITGASDNSFGIQQATGALNASGAITLFGTSKNWVGVVTGGAINAGGALSITGKKTTNSGYQGVNIASAVKGASVNIIGGSVNHWGVGIGAGKTVEATGGDVTINGTSGTSQGINLSDYSNTGSSINATGNVNLVGNAGNDSQSSTTGVKIYGASTITAGNSINITGTVNTVSAGSSGNGVDFNRFASAAKLTATGNINIEGTLTGLGSGSGVILNKASGGQSGQAPMMDAGGTFTLRGNNNRGTTSTSNTSAAISGASGVQVTAGSDIVIQAETQNAASYAMNFTSLPTNQYEGNASFKSTGGNVLIQSNQGSILFNNAMATSNVTSAPYATLTEISGRNITIDNTGAGMATGAGTRPGSGGTTGATVDNTGFYKTDSTTGAVTISAGAGSATGDGINLASKVGIAMNATQNINIVGKSTGGNGVLLNTTTTAGVVVNAAGDVKIDGTTTASNTSMGVYLASASTVTGKNVDINGSSVNGNAVQSTTAVKATGGDVNITGTSTGALNTASALSLTGKITASDNVAIVGNNTHESNGSMVAYINKEVTATTGKVDVTTTTGGIANNALRLDSGAILKGQTEVNIKTDSLNITTTATLPAMPAIINAGQGTGKVTITTESHKAKINIGDGTGTGVSASGVDIPSATKMDRTLGLTNAELNRITAGNLVIGDTSNLGGITVSAATTTNAATGNVTLQTDGNIAINAALTVGGSTATKKLALQAGGNVTQTAGAAIKAAELQLKGLSSGGNFKLTEKTNSVGKLAAAANKVEFNNAGALEVGEVDVLGLTTPVSTAVSGITTAAGASITTQTGDLTITKAISNTELGDVVLGAGVTSEAGQDLTSNVKTTSSAGVTHTNGNLYVYTGSSGAGATGNLSSLDGSLSDLNLSAVGSNGQNADSYVKYNSSSLGISDAGTTAQVMFREKVAMELSTGASVNHTYGDANTKNDATSKTALWDEVKNALGTANSSVTKKTDAGTFNIAGSALANDLSESTLTSPSYSISAGYLNYTASGYSYEALSGNKYVTTLASGKVVKVVMSKKDVNLASITADGKTYNGNDSATITAVNLRATDLVGSETLGASATGTFDSKNAGSRTATVTAANTTLANGTNGGLADNYNVVGTKTATATIAKKDVNLDSITAAGKTYNGNDTATITAVTLKATDLVGSETLGASATGTFDSKNAGSRTATVTAANTTLANGTNGGLADNYNVVGSKTVAATIAKANLTITLADQTKEYDGLLTATLAPSSITVKGVTVANQTESAAVNQTVAAYNDKNVTGATNVTANLSTANFTAAPDTDLNNYNLPTSVTGKGAITTKQLTLTGTTVADKTYDGKTSATVTNTGTLNGLVVGETLDVTATGKFEDSGVGNQKPVRITGVLADRGGNLATNYRLANAQAIANITAAIKPPSPVVPTDGTSRVKIPVGSTNPFALASAEDLADDTCSANSIENCQCEESAVSQGVSICYEPKAGAKGTAH